jgi:hypothetical protein
MNIFYVDKDPYKSAQYLCDKHVVKMILESAQLLCTAHHVHPYFKLPSFLYKPTHKNHPSAVWVRQSLKNYLWLGSHANGLCKEYTYRYGKVHKTQAVIDWLSKHYPDIRYTDFTEPPQCMPDEFKVINDSVSAYRNYYKLGKMPIIDCRWTRREQPDWI